ncbi:MAG: sigma-70 family RNA polymerase sigma factor [Candidatus Acidiferrales bacterium]
MSSLRNNPVASLDFPAPAEVRLGTGAVELENEIVGLFDEFRDRLLRYILSLGLPVLDAEEVIQEVFLALFRHLRLGKPRSNLRGWIFRVAHNLALKRRLADRKWQKRVEFDETLLENQLDRSPNPEQQIAGAQTQERLLAIVRALPQQDQRCLSLRAEGLRYREIAKVLGMSLGAVSISLTRSFARLRCADEG